MVRKLRLPGVHCTTKRPPQSRIDRFKLAQRHKKQVTAKLGAVLSCKMALWDESWSVFDVYGCKSRQLTQPDSPGVSFTSGSVPVVANWQPHLYPISIPIKGGAHVKMTHDRPTTNDSGPIGSFRHFRCGLRLAEGRACRLRTSMGPSTARYLSQLRSSCSTTRSPRLVLVGGCLGGCNLSLDYWRGSSVGMPVSLG